MGLASSTVMLIAVLLTPIVPCGVTILYRHVHRLHRYITRAEPAGSFRLSRATCSAIAGHYQRLLFQSCKKCDEVVDLIGIEFDFWH
jgi:hypothetical protein